MENTVKPTAATIRRASDLFRVMRQCADWKKIIETESVAISFGHDDRSDPVRVVPEDSEALRAQGLAFVEKQFQAARSELIGMGYDPDGE